MTQTEERDLAALNKRWANEIIEGLKIAGVSLFAISPGSRSTALVMAASQSKVRTIVHFDERGASYFALGWSKQAQLPSALICTSGTAFANYLPAIIEASHGRVPLVILSADRPPELHDRGANQTTHQKDGYGDYVRLFKDLGCSDSQHLKGLKAKVATYAGYLKTPLPGPIHLNCPFREPLFPSP